MPIGKISKSGNSFSGAAEYDLAQGKYRTENSKKKPQVLENNLIFAHHYKEIGREFRSLALKNKRCSKPVLKFSISFDPTEVLTDSLKLEFTKLVMAEMGITDDHQYIITRHIDKAHDHHHILLNRVGLDGKVWDDSYGRNRLETCIDKVEKMLGIDNSLAEKRRYVYDPNNEKGYTVQLNNFNDRKEKTPTKNSKKGVDKKKSYIQNHVDFALINSRDFNSFYMLLKKKKIETELRFNNDGKLAGISFNYDNYSIKGSGLGTNFKANNIEKRIKANFEANKINSTDIPTDLNKENTVSVQTLVDKTKANNNSSNQNANFSDFEKSKILANDIQEINEIINTK